MASLNTALKLVTHEGARAAHITPAQELTRTVMSCLLWENTFYENGVSIADRICQLVTINKPEDVARIALEAKHQMRLRHTPLLLVSELCAKARGLAAETLKQIVSRPDDLTEFLAIYWRNGKRPLPAQIKKVLGNALRKFDEYQLAKYSGGSKSIKLRDVIRITHPKPSDISQAALWQRLVGNKLVAPDTWDVEISKTKDKKTSWERLIREGKLGGLATLRNIRNMRKADIDIATIREGIRSIKSGKLLPINFISAAIHNPELEPELEGKFFECFADKPKLAGRTVILVDVSGSMAGHLSSKSELRRIDVACSLAMIAREMFNEVGILTFNDTLTRIAPRRGFALRDAVITNLGGGTYLGNAIASITPDYDRLIVITDEQSADNVPSVKNGYMINVASYKNGVGYGEWLHIDGWSDKVLDYIVQYESDNLQANIPASFA